MDEDLENIRRSLAMAPSLPGDQAERLLNEVKRLRHVRRDLAAELDALTEEVNRLHRLAADASPEPF